MFRNRGENLRSIYVLLFLNVAFFLLQHQDPSKFIRLFAFDWHLFAGGEFWRAFTYQFTQAGGAIGPITIPPVVTLFLNLILLTLMGMAVEEEWGTFHFLNFYLISTLTTAGAAAYLNTPLIGSFFINFTLLFVYATLYRDQTFYLLVIPIRVRFLAWLALAALGMRVVFGGRSDLAVLIGSAAGYAYFLSQRVRVITLKPRRSAEAPEDTSVTAMTRNLARVAAVKKALGSASQKDIDRLIAISEAEIVRGVNICSPVDYKPEHSDRYCVRCEGFAECTARHLRLNRPARVEVRPDAVTES